MRAERQWRPTIGRDLASEIGGLRLASGAAVFYT